MIYHIWILCDILATGIQYFTHFCIHLKSQTSFYEMIIHAIPHTLIACGILWMVYRLYIILLISGKREIVGFGWNGLPTYVDRCEFPFPSIRFKETTPEILALREKEKGDWKKLTIEEKKACEFAVINICVFSFTWIWSQDFLFDVSVFV